MIDAVRNLVYNVGWCTKICVKVSVNFTVLWPGCGMQMRLKRLNINYHIPNRFIKTQTMPLRHLHDNYSPISTLPSNALT
jgi:hypothetical protein